MSVLSQTLSFLWLWIQLWQCSPCVYIGNPDGTPAKPLWTLPETVAVLQQAYCGSVALEYKHLWQQDEMAWIEERYETRPSLSAGEKAGVLRLLLAADYLERFLSQKFPATKRCEG